ncbi:hypothetical protein DFH09DRAFT_1176630, partial [Mycena vulgaris]
MASLSPSSLCLPPSPALSRNTTGVFTKICFTLLSAAQSLSVNAPSSVTSGGQTTITWSSTPPICAHCSSPPHARLSFIFRAERSLSSSSTLHSCVPLPSTSKYSHSPAPLFDGAQDNAVAIANNVDPTTNTLTLTIPSVPAEDGYTLQFVN